MYHVLKGAGTRTSAGPNGPFLGSRDDVALGQSRRGLAVLAQTACARQAAVVVGQTDLAVLILKTLDRSQRGDLDARPGVGRGRGRSRPVSVDYDRGRAGDDDRVGALDGLGLLDGDRRSGREVELDLRRLPGGEKSHRQNQMNSQQTERPHPHPHRGLLSFPFSRVEETH